MESSSVNIDLSFSHSWEVEVLPGRPLILPKRRFVYPQIAEEVERGAMEVLISPSIGRPFLATCALGFSDPAVPTGVFSMPHEDWILAVSGGYAYAINTLSPEQFEQISFRPVLDIEPLVEHGLMLFTSHYSVMAWGKEGLNWQSERLSAEGVELVSVKGNVLRGKGWDMISDQDLDFSLDLKTGLKIDSND